MRHVISAGALARQTDRVALSETVSRSSLLALAEADFEEARREPEQAPSAVLARLDKIVGLAGVKV